MQKIQILQLDKLKKSGPNAKQLPINYSNLSTRQPKIPKQKGKKKQQIEKLKKFNL